MNAAEDFYFEAPRQLRLKRWSKGRGVLTEDAAWCATPVAGIGTTLDVTVLTCPLANFSGPRTRWTR